MSGRLANDVAKGLNLLSVNGSEEAARDISMLLAKFSDMNAAAAAAAGRFRVTKAQLSNYPAAKYPGVVLVLSDFSNLEVISDGVAWRALRRHRIAGSNDPLPSTNTTSWEALVSHVIPGGVMGINGGLEVSVWAESAGANTGNRDIIIRYGGTVLGEGRLAAAGTAQAYGFSKWKILNVNEASQIGRPATFSAFTSIGSATSFKPGLVNSAVDQQLQIITAKSVGTDDLKILHWEVEVLPPLA